jgi:enoyl-CoA hydratase
MIDDMINGVRTIALQREPKNTVDLVTIQTLTTLFEAHPPTVPLVFTGANGVFCAGVDAKAFIGYSGDRRLEMARAITRMTAALLAIPSPVIAAVTGHALGGGLVMALCCDYRVVTNREDAKFGLLEGKAGIAFPSGPSAIVQAELPAGLMRQLTLTSRMISAAELVQHAVFDECVGDELVLERAQAFALELAAQPGFCAVKEQMRGALRDQVAHLAALGVEAAFAQA